MSIELMSPKAKPKNPLMSVAQCAKYLNISVSTLKVRVYRGDGPPMVDLGVKRMLFRPADVDGWVASLRTKK
jgi:predicted DNA-binding transcriptional regulator AlpA